MNDYDKISGFSEINNVDENKVNQLINSMLGQGWQGAPILYCDLGLVTGSHRIAALKKIEEMYINDDLTLEESRVLDEVKIINVMDEINDYCEKTGYTWNGIDFSGLGEVFEETYIEQYKNEIVEW